MPTIAIVLIAVLAAHYFLAVGTLFVLLRDKGVTKAIIAWNLVILLIPIAGPAAYWICRTVAKSRGGQTVSGNADATERPAEKSETDFGTENTDNTDKKD